MSTKLNQVIPGRKRRTAGRTLLALGAIVAAVWVWSGWFEIQFSLSSPRWCYRLTQGTFVAGTDINPIDLPWSFQVTLPQGSRTSSTSGWCWRATQLWWINWQLPELGVKDLYFTACTSTRGKAIYFAVVLWPIPLLLWTPAAALLRSSATTRRRSFSNTCAKCGYSL